MGRGDTDMGQWSKILTSNELDAHYAFTAKIDPVFAAKQREFYNSRTENDLRAHINQAWNCNDADGYQLARSHLVNRSA
jgi:hypothetical protein